AITISSSTMSARGNDTVRDIACLQFLAAPTSSLTRETPLGAMPLNRFDGQCVVRGEGFVLTTCRTPARRAREPRAALAPLCCALGVGPEQLEIIDDPSGTTRGDDLGWRAERCIDPSRGSRSVGTGRGRKLRRWRPAGEQRQAWRQGSCEQARQDPQERLCEQEGGGGAPL